MVVKGGPHLVAARQIVKTGNGQPLRHWNAQTQVGQQAAFGWIVVADKNGAHFWVGCQLALQLLAAQRHRRGLWAQPLQGSFTVLPLTP